MYCRLTWAVAVWAACASAAWAWSSYQFDLPSQAPEALWRDALAAELHAKHEVVIEGGRIDVMTDTQAIELDWPHKWHEGLGQALHYADATDKKPVLALISYSRGPDKMMAKTRERLDMVEKYCRKHGVELLVLFPTQPRLYGRDESDNASNDSHSTNLWLNTGTGVRHSAGCRYFQSSLDGRACGADEGKPCRICGGK
jgi:hypothetical protein